MTSSAAESDESTGEQRAADERFEKKWTRISMWLLAASPVLFIVAIALSGFGLYPYDYMMPVGLVAALTPVGLSLLVGACAGLYLLGGPKAAPFGAVFVAGFGVLGYGIAEADTVWRDVGVALLTISCASFFVAPAMSPRAKKKKRERRQPTTATQAGLGGVFVTGVVLAIIGHLSDEWWQLLFGALTVGTVAGIGIAMWIENRRLASEPG
jgi:hypothetical protein